MPKYLLVALLVYTRRATSQSSVSPWADDARQSHGLTNSESYALRQDVPLGPAQWSPSRRSCIEGCTSRSCLEGAKEKGPGGVPVCGDGTQCRILAQGCEICPAPIFEVTNAGMQVLQIGDLVLEGYEPGMALYSFEKDATVTMKRVQTSVCTLLCWTYNEIQQTGLSKLDDALPRYAVACGNGEPCGNSQNPCVDLTKPDSVFEVSPGLLLESTLVQARLFNLEQRTSSDVAAIYFVDKAYLVRNVICGDGYTVNREYKTSEVDTELCDDGNKNQFDGCDQHCNIEAGFTCQPNTTNPALSNCTGSDPAQASSTDMYQVFINFGAPLAAAVILLCCCVFIRRFNPGFLKTIMPFGIHAKLAVVGLGLEELEDKKPLSKVKEKSKGQMRKEIEDENQMATHMAEAIKKRENFKQWQIRLQVVEAQFLPVCDVGIRDAHLVGLADPYATVKVVALGEKDQNKNNVVYRTETQYSTLFPYWNREFRIDFDGAEDLIVVDVWDWDAGKQDDWIGRAQFKGWYFIEAYMEGAPYGRVGQGGGIVSDAAGAKGAIGSPYTEDDWFELLDKKGRKIVNKQYKKEARIKLGFRVDRNYDPVQAIESMMDRLFLRKTATADVLKVGKDAMTPA